MTHQDPNEAAPGPELSGAQLREAPSTFRRPDGSPVTIGELVAHLQAGGGFTFTTATGPGELIPGPAPP